MFLERIKIVNFRGINRINLKLDDSTLLIGENAWGKTSLLEALTLFLSRREQPYKLDEHDFHRQKNSNNDDQEWQLTIKFIFCEARIKAHQTERYQKLEPIWRASEDDPLFRICYCIQGGRNAHGEVTTHLSFLDANEKVIELADPQKMVDEIQRLHPLLRLRYAGLTNSLTDQSKTEFVHKYLPMLSSEENESGTISEQSLWQSVSVISSILENYFTKQASIPISTSSRRYNPNTMDWNSLGQLNQTLASSSHYEARLALLHLFVNMLMAQEGIELDTDAQPILLLEEPESQLHPVMLSVAWGLIANVPLQKITTTNSGELLSLVPIERICRMIRKRSEVATYRVYNLSSEEQRRIVFHIRLNRSASLFYRCWFLVEGETEVWLLSAMARQCGYYFEAEGIKLIEFAQCGLKPLIKLATQLGIEWYVLTDGDSAGKKYADTVRGLSGDKKKNENMTLLPARDIEHFMYDNGFAHVYRRIAAIPDNVHLTTHKIIQKAIKRTSKPDLAIEIITELRQRGVDAVPKLFKNVFSRIIQLVKRASSPEDLN